MILKRPELSQVPGFYQKYLSYLEEDNPLELLVHCQEKAHAMYAQFLGDHELLNYQQDKWTVRQMLQHVNDAERVMAYRALRIARNDKTELPGYNQDLFAQFDQANDRTLADLLQEAQVLRESSLLLFKSLPEQAWERKATANGYSIDVLLLAYIIAGHQMHHVEVLRTHYLPLLG